MAIDRRRSIPLAAIRSLAQVPGCSFISLQKGEPANQPPPPGLALHDFTAELSDFGDTAALAAALDLGISVDTSVAHLSAAMGKPTWIVLPAVADWRWLRHRRDTPWYPSVMLFRQPKIGDWTAVLEAVRRALTELFR